MPWHWEPMKDVTSCDKLRLGANIRLPADLRMWEHSWGNAQLSPDESIVREKGTRGTETSKYPEEEKSNEIPLVAASERGRGQTKSSDLGLWTLIWTQYV